MIVCHFVWLGNNHCKRALEVVRPMSYVNAHVSNVDYVREAIVLFENGFEVSPH